MILIPEIEVVMILVPRTGSGSLRRAIADRYPRSMQVYRHMEADGVPQGYDRWKKIGVARNPIDRLWSLYKFLTHFAGEQHDPAYIKAMRDSVAMPFSDWIVRNQTVFTCPYDCAGLGRFFPLYTCRHPMPENRKSQFVYLRPDLGTQIYGYESLNLLTKRLGLQLGSTNRTEQQPPTVKPCAECGEPAAFLCDFIVTRFGKTCDRRMCDRDRHRVAPEIDYCHAHYAQWIRGGGKPVPLPDPPPVQPSLFGET